MKIRKRFVALVAAAALMLGGAVAAAPASAALVTVGTQADTYKPVVNANPGSTPVELGFKFRPTKSGTLKGIQFYQNLANSGVTSVSLWSATGTKIAGATVNPSGTVGWRTITVNATLTANTYYTVSVWDSNGNFPVTRNFYTTATVVNGIEVPVGAGKNRGTQGYPTGVTSNSNYLIDVVYEYDNGVVTPPPTTQYNYLGRSWPDTATTGVPAGTVLSNYTGPCTITTAGLVIDKQKILGCDDFRIYAQNVVIKNSEIHARVYADYNEGVGSFAISDSSIVLGPYPTTGIGDANFTATRVKVTGGGRGIACYAFCTVTDSYVVGGFVDNSGTNHMSGIRVNTNSTLIHNTIGCDAPDIAPDAGCSAAITGYPDFDPVKNNRIENNLILGNSGGYCTYGGATQGKAYSNDPTNATNIVFKDNVWQKGTSGQCGFWGPITSFDSTRSGNIWSNNLYTDGSAVPAAN